MINLNVVKKSSNQVGAGKFYLTTENVVPMMADALYMRVASECALTRADMRAVLSALEERVIQHLLDGESVRFGDFGSFRVTLHSKGQSVLSKCSSADVKRVNVRFTPSSRMRNAFKLGVSDKLKLAIKKPEAA